MLYSGIHYACVTCVCCVRCVLHGFSGLQFFLFFFFARTDEESVERKASRKEREGRARKGALTKTTGEQGKHYGTSQQEQHPYSRGNRESVP